MSTRQATLQDLADRIAELEARMKSARECQTYVVHLDDCEQTWFKKEDVLKALNGEES
jgi:hypothetical protein